MARYIDAEKLTAEYIELQYSDQTMGIVCNRYLSEIKRVARQPTADVAEVVRCKDCVYWECGKDYEPYCNHFGNMMADTKADDFCSYGERKNHENRNN